MRVWLIVGLIVVGALVWLWNDTRKAAEPPVEKSAPAPAVVTRAPTAPSPASKPRTATLPRPLPFDASSRHTADPCTALVEPVIPAGFEQITEANITVAWDPAEVAGPYDAPLRPVALAHTVAGVLEEAAQLTGTDRRQQLTVIVDGSAEDLQSRTKTPVWVGGLYDGGAIHVPAKGNADLGVAITTLRHELMHAQIHAAIGCVPFWFNEGLANYFAGATSPREWIAMARTGESFDLATLRDPAILDLKHEQASRMYAVSLAMVVYLVHAKGELGIREAVRIAQNSDAPLGLWELVLPNVDYRVVVDSLAQKVFGAPPGPELDILLRGTVCCRNLRQPAELSCRAPSAESSVRREICRRW